MKQIYWIDDDFKQMLYIIQGAIAKLWKIKWQSNEEKEARIRSNIVIFGDAYLENDSDKLASKEDEDQASEQLSDFYMECCIKEDGPNPDKPTYRKNIDLVENVISYVFRNDIDGDREKYNDIKNVWSGKDSKNDKEERYTTAKKKVTELIPRMNIADGAVVGIDLLLLHGDFMRVKNGERIISMELFYQLRANNFKCFLYSSETDEIDFTEKWKKIYTELYMEKNASEGENAVKIYRRQDFLRKGSEDVVEEVERLLTT